jgi:hypothetical protein
MIAAVNLDNDLIKEEIKQQVHEVVKDMYPWQPIMNKELATKYSGFGVNRMDAVFYLYKRILDENNGGCVMYPEKGQTYLIKRSGFDKFLEKYARDIRNVDLEAYQKDRVAYRANMWR